MPTRSQIIPKVNKGENKQTDKNKVRVYIWETEGEHGVGHAAVSVTKNAYFSFWPKALWSGNLLSAATSYVSPAKLATKQEDESLEGRPADRIYELRVTEKERLSMVARMQTIEKSISNDKTGYTFFPNHPLYRLRSTKRKPQHCASSVADVLGISYDQTTPWAITPTDLGHIVEDKPNAETVKTRSENQLSGLTVGLKCNQP